MAIKFKDPVLQSPAEALFTEEERRIGIINSSTLLSSNVFYLDGQTLELYDERIADIEAQLRRMKVGRAFLQIAQTLGCAGSLMEE